jgi:hypothetical protein
MLYDVYTVYLQVFTYNMSIMKHNVYNVCMLLYIVHRILYNLYDFVMKEGRGSVPLHTLKVNYLAVSYLYKVNGL